MAWFRRPKNVFDRFPARPQPGRSLTAIGDIHGCFDLLYPLVEQILVETPRPGDLVFLGDYVDRGPQSREVIEYLCALPARSPLDCHFVRGNHDEMLLKFLHDPSAGAAWCEFGGRETLRSYGVTLSTTPTIEEWEAVRQEFSGLLPSRHWAFLAETSSSLTFGDFFLTHAGARPGVPLEQQLPQDLMWIRSAFLDDKKRFAAMVIHGHTPNDAVHVDHRRIGIDTGSYATGTLTAVRLSEQGRGFLQARRQPGGQVSVSPVEV